MADVRPEEISAILRRQLSGFENEADIYPRFGPTMEWDTCASHIIVEESGKNIYSIINNSILKYNKENLKNDNFICANL